ncbi:MAG: molybdopterin cofactor-binding domain-containing protein [Ferruginibacter sp.]
MENNKPSKKVSRRKFIIKATLGSIGGLVLGTYLFRKPIYRSIAGYVNTLSTPYEGSKDDPIIWFEITPDNKVILQSPKVEMGQGIFTGLAQIAADELEVDINQIKVIHAPSATGNMDAFGTGGSTSISSLWQPLRELAATMREMLKTEAANKLGVAVTTLSVAKGVVSGGGKSITYAEIVKGVDKWKVPATPALKAIKDYQYVGQPIARVDLQAKVFGEPIYGMDAVMPDMLYGSIVRPNKVGAQYMDADTNIAEKIPGVVKIVKEKDFVGVVAVSQTAAEKAKNAITANWKVDKIWQTHDIENMIKVGKGDAIEIQKTGKAANILEDKEGLITMEFTSPIGAHAQIEPNGALAFVEKDKATIYISTQVVKITRSEVADRLGLKTEQVNIIPTFLGGGFGRRLHTPHAVQAALLSKAVGKPVKYFFNRQEEFQHDTFRPPTHHLLKAKLNAAGMITAMEHNVSSGDVMYGSALVPAIMQNLIGSDLGAWRGGMINYTAIPNYRAVSWRVKLPFATSWWRSLGLLANTFAIESFMDELAIKANQDPVAFRLAQIKDDTIGKRLKEVIRVAAEKSNYNNKAVNGIAMGFACCIDVGTPCAQVAEVTVVDGKIKVLKVTCVIDPGIVVNPNQVKAQCEGAIIMGMSAAMFERMYIEDGELKPIIYGPYKIASIKDAPREIEVIILQNDDKPGGVGEPPLGPIGAAIGNAVRRLTGTRLTDMPLTLG